MGLDVPTLWENLATGRSGIRPISGFDTGGFNVTIAGEVPGFDPLAYMPAKDARRTDRFTQSALAALGEALGQSGLQITAHNAGEIGVIVGSGVGGIWTYSAELEVLRTKGPKRVNPLLVPTISVDVPAVQIALRTGAKGPNFADSAACATGAQALGEGYETLRHGHALAMLAGGFEDAVTPIGIASFDQLRDLSLRNHNPAGASRPFDGERDGFVMADGGALLILEELGFARARGADPLAEILSLAATSAAVHLTAPDQDGAGAARCMQLALARAGLDPEQIDYINAHATGTPNGDIAEVRAIQAVCGGRRRRIPVSSTKSMTGHLLAGAGSLEAAICVQTLHQQLLPPTTNQHTPDPACDLDTVPNDARPAVVTNVLTNAFGFGGHNVSLILGACHGD